MIKVYATNQNGKGFVSLIGEYQNIEDIQIRVGMYSDDVVIGFSEEPQPENEFNIDI